MFIGSILTGIVCGTLAAAVSLLMGHPLLLSLIRYVEVGIAATLVMAAITYAVAVLCPKARARGRLPAGQTAGE